MVRQGSSLTWLSIRIRLQGRKPGESNKLFDLIVLTQDTIRPIRKICGSEIYTHPLDGILLQERLPHARQNGLFLFIALERMAAFIYMKVLICF